jgi:hypothetical protein
MGMREPKAVDIIVIFVIAILFLAGWFLGEQIGYSKGFSAGWLERGVHEWEQYERYDKEKIEISDTIGYGYEIQVLIDDTTLVIKNNKVIH